MGTAGIWVQTTAMKILPYLALLAALPFQSCKKSGADPKSELPAATTTGAETLGFRVFGGVWVPAGRVCGIYGCADNQVEASAYRNPDGTLNLQISAYRTGTRLNQAFVLTVDSLGGSGVYPARLTVPKSNGGHVNNQLSFTDNEFGGVAYQSLLNGATTITITKVDTVQSIVSGTFEGRLDESTNAGRTIELTDGRFDVLYNR
jgi:hypothetical protein